MNQLYCRYLLVLMLLCVFCIVPAIAQTSNDYWAPWVTETTTSTATINWRGESDGSGLIYYDTTSYFNQHHSFEYTISTQQATQYQHVPLRNLSPNTSYTYWVRPSGDMSAFGNRTFRTMPISGPFTFLVVCDSQEGSHYMETKRFKYVADAMANETNALFILLGGDFARFDNESRWTTFFQLADRTLANSTLFPVIGNHEYHNIDQSSQPTSAVQYHSAFDMPLNYSFDCADIRFVVLNSPDPNSAQDEQTSLALAESQAPWLQQLLDNNMKGIFTIHHHPIWDFNRTTINRNLTSWEQLYHKYNISANFAGHTHNYQRYNVYNVSGYNATGIPYFVVGIGGGECAQINSSDTFARWYKFGLSMQLGYLKVTVDPANNTATAWEITVGNLTNADDDEIPQLFNPPVINDTITFPLRPNAPYNPPTCNASKTIKIEGNQYATAYGPGSAASNIVIVTPQEPRIGANSATYNINVVGNSDVGGNKVVAKNVFGKIESDTSTLTVNTSDSEDILSPPNTNEQAYQKGRRSERSERSL
jgi:hypothetical protein